MPDVCQLPAHELVGVMSSGAVTCREVIEAHLARIDADGRAARGGPLGRAHGLPVVVKDVMKGRLCSA